MRLCHFLHALTIAAALAPLVVVSHSAASDCDSSPAAVCSRCGEKVCVTFVSPATETRSCWDVECEEVCIPAVRCPWHACPTADCDICSAAPLPRYGKVRRVRKLKPVEYECDTCRYEHRIVCRCPNCGPVPHAECACVPLAATSAEQNTRTDEPPMLPSEQALQTSLAPEQTEVAAEPESPQPLVKPRWSDRIRARLVSWKQSFGPQPKPVEGDLSELVGHTRFGNPQAD